MTESDTISTTLTDRQLTAWAAADGFDLGEADELLDAAAVGVTLGAWRNTTVEAVRVGYATSSADDCTVRTRDDALRRLADAEPDVAAQQSRLDRVVDSARNGLGIPADVVLRLNVCTALQIRDVLAGFVDDFAEPGDDRFPSGDSCPNVFAALSVLAEDPARPLRVGAAITTARDLFSAEAWEEYHRDVLAYIGRLLVFADRIGVRRTLWWAAVAGHRHADRWFPQPAWPDVCDTLRLTGAVFDAADDDVWTRLETAPHTLTTPETEAVMAHRLDRVVERHRVRRARNLGAQPEARVADTLAATMC